MFHSARIKLTLWYLIIIICISMSFSVVIYRVLTAELERFARIQRVRIERKYESLMPSSLPLKRLDPELIEETKERLLLNLIFINGAIIFLSGGLGYFLAGKTLRPIQEMINEQNRFISDASHELRTPLTSIKSAYEVFLRNKNQSLEEAQTLATESIQEVNKLQMLSESLLGISILQESPEIAKEPFSINEVVSSAIESIKQMANKNNIKLIYKKNDINAKGRKKDIVNVISILLDNAIKYSAKNTTVIISAERKVKSISINVEDQGIGIDGKDLPYVFNRFYRADAARSKNNAAGYGLGLSIAKKIIESHKGRIFVQSKFNKGSRFTIELPI